MAVLCVSLHLEIKCVGKSNQHILIVPGIARGHSDFLLKPDPMNTLCGFTSYFWVRYRCRAKEKMPFCPADPRQETKWTRIKRKKASPEGTRKMRWAGPRRAGPLFSQKSWSWRKRRGCREAVLKSFSRLASSRMRNGVSGNGKERCWQETLRPTHKGFKWKYESKGGIWKSRACTGQACPSYGHHRRAGAQKSQGKPGEIDQSGQPSQPPGALGSRQEVSCKGGIGVWEEIHRVPWGGAAWKRFTDEPDREVVQEEATTVEESAQALRMANSKALGVSKRLRLTENVEDCGSVEPQCPQYLISLLGGQTCLQDHWSAALMSSPSPCCQDTSSRPRTHTLTALLLLPHQSGLHVCFLCWPQPCRQLKGYLIQLLCPVLGMADSGHRVDTCPVLHTHTHTHTHTECKLSLHGLCLVTQSCPTLLQPYGL